MSVNKYNPTTGELTPIAGTSVNIQPTQELIADVATSPTQEAYQVGDQIIYNNVLYDVIDDISSGDSLEVGVNIVAATRNISERMAEIEDSYDGLSDLVAPTETSPAEAAHATGDFLIYAGELYEVISAISINDTLVVGTNIEKSTMMEEIKDSSSLSDLIAPTEVSPSTAAYAVDDYLIFNKELCKVTTAIAIGDALVKGTNIEKTTMMKELKTSGGGGGTTIIPVFTVENNEVYPHTGSAQGPSIIGLDTSKVNISNATAIDTGIYTMTLTLKDPSTMVWSDFTNTPKSYQYIVGNIYGVSWDGENNSTWARTGLAKDFSDPIPAVNNGNGSSPFDNILPWSGMQIVDDTTAGKLVSIPKYYYKWVKNGSAMSLQISQDPLEGFLVSPAHADRDGNGERDVVYIGRYHCATNTYKSTSGVKPQANKSRSAFRSSIHGLGNEYWQYDFAMYWTVMMLYLVEYADWDSQKTIGYGCGNNSSVENSGLTNNMTYHTGTNAANRTTYGHVQYRYIEDLWANVYDWCDGIYFAGTNKADVYVINNPTDFSDATGGTKIGTRPTESNYIKAFNIPNASGFEWALYPSEVSSDASYVGDQCYYGSSGVVLYVGGYYYQSQYHGAFYLYGNVSASDAYAHVGSRLQKLPVQG